MSNNNISDVNAFNLLVVTAAIGLLGLFTYRYFIPGTVSLVELTTFSFIVYTFVAILDQNA